MSSSMCRSENGAATTTGADGGCLGGTRTVVLELVITRAPPLVGRGGDGRICGCGELGAEAFACIGVLLLLLFITGGALL